MVRTNNDLALCTLECTCCTGICFPLVLIAFLRCHIAQTIVANKFKSFPVSMIVSTKSWKLEKRGLEPVLPHTLLWDQPKKLRGTTKLHGSHPRAHHGNDHSHHPIVPFGVEDCVLLEKNS